MFQRMAKLTSCLPILLLAANALAQQNAPAQRQERREDRRQNLSNAADRAAQPAREIARSADSTIAMMVIPGNQAEITFGRMAEQRSMNRQVKAFAQQMIQDHTKFLTELRPYAGVAAGPAAPEDAATEPRTTRDANPGVEVNAGPGGADVAVGNSEIRAGATPPAARRPVAGQEHGSLDLWRVDHQIAQRCQAMEQQMLAEKQGAEFDKGYVGSQIGAHVHMLAKLEVLSDYASPELREKLDQGIKTTQTHLQHAKQLMRQLDQAVAQERPEGAQPNTTNQRPTAAR